MRRAGGSETEEHLPPGTQANSEVIFTTEKCFSPTAFTKFFLVSLALQEQGTEQDHKVRHFFLKTKKPNPTQPTNKPQPCYLCTRKITALCISQLTQGGHALNFTYIQHFNSQVQEMKKRESRAISPSKTGNTGRREGGGEALITPIRFQLYFTKNILGNFTSKSVLRENEKRHSVTLLTWQ